MVRIPLRKAGYIFLIGAARFLLPVEAFTNTNSPSIPAVAALTLDGAIKMAAEHSPELSIKRAGIEAKRGRQHKGWSNLLPKANVVAGFREIDKNHAENSMGLYPEDHSYVGLSVDQLIFSDGAYTDIRVAARDVNRAKLDITVTRLDVMAAAGEGFLRYLTALRLLQVEKSDLDLIARNLRLARDRERSEVSSREEVYGWESREAHQRKAVLEAESQVQIALISLNSVMGVEQTMQWSIGETGWCEPVFLFDNKPPADLLDDPARFERLAVFFMEQAARRSWVLASLQEAIEAQKIVLDQLRRKWRMPVVSATIRYDYIVDETRVGIPEGVTLDLDDTEWLVMLRASIPFFEGTGRFAEITEATAALEELSARQFVVRRDVEQRALTAWHRFRSSYPAIRLAGLAAAKAKANLEVVEARYREGIAPLVEMLDAENRAFAEERAVAAAVYTCQQDIVELQLAVSCFECTATPETMADWRAEFRKADNTE